MFAKDLNAFLFWLTPDHMRDSVHDFKKIRMFLISHVFGPFISIPFVIYLFINDPDPYPILWILAASFFSFWLIPFALKKYPKSYYFLALLSVQNYAFAILWGAFNYGGGASPFLMWVLLMPLFAFFYLGASFRNQITIFALLAANLAIFYGAHHSPYFVPSHIPVNDLFDISMLSTLTAAVFIFSLANYYARIVDSQSELVKEAERHESTLAQLTHAKEEAERASRAKSDFLANMSHELRTPLNAVLGYSEILLEDAELDGRREEIADLQKISAAGKHLLAMVNDILDISKIEAGKVDLYLETFSLDKFITEVEEAARPIAAKKSNVLVLEKGDNLGDVYLDSTKLRQSVLNLLSNAGKFTENGQINLSVERTVQNGEDWIRISVRDTGVGISEENMKNLFQNFTQANSSITKKFGGTGLGLSLSQNLCQLMGGNILLESKLGEGACFTIQLPAKVVKKRDVEQETAPALGDEAKADKPLNKFERYKSSIDDEKQTGELDKVAHSLHHTHVEGSKVDDPSMKQPIDHRKTILVVDDDRNFLDVAERVLDREGYQAILTDAPETVLQLALTVKPEIILLDVVMPGLDGWDVLVTLNSEPETAQIPIIMMSNVSDREKARGLQAAGFIEKPLDGEKFRALLNKIENSRTSMVG